MKYSMLSLNATVFPLYFAIAECLIYKVVVALKLEKKHDMAEFATLITRYVKCCIFITIPLFLPACILLFLLDH